ncbi:hypothetical protein [Paenibacillus harenae]|uniref:hypothetical protein n=1 Tax=Paenibacillus harenae TaxID=306543 RepID=UPI00278D654D|nr:hypothetical protein [Paenibacillus harenae]MDQ0062384.1 hypothetical protein [Paenibacillus harenae]
MLNPLDQVERNLVKTEHHLMFHLILEQQETNRLLREISESSKGVETREEIKRPELMKRMAKLANKPQGWNKWSNEEIIEHLKGVS